VRVGLCYPSPYHVGMSSLGFQAVYREIHAAPFATAERIFLPDDEAQGAPVSIESQRSVRDFSVLALSVAYELELTGVISLLKLAG
jgi:hypothetical protein